MRKGIEQRPEQRARDEALMREPDSFGQIFEAFHPKIFGFLVRRTGNIQTAEDLASETFEKAFRAKETFNPEIGSLNNWLFRIAKNSLTDSQRRESLCHSPSFREAESTLFNPNYGDIQKTMEAKEIVGSINEGLSGLTDRQRKVVLLRLTTNMSNREIGEELGLTEGAIKSLLFRALPKIQEAVAKER